MRNQVCSSGCIQQQNRPFRAAAVLGGCTAVILPLEGAVVALGTLGFAVAALEKGFEVAEAGLDAEEPVVGLQRRTHTHVPHVKIVENNKRTSQQPNLFALPTPSSFVWNANYGVAWLRSGPRLSASFFLAISCFFISNN